MRGVRILEVAQFTFTPSAGAVLADWGADVIKVEHAETGDAQRSLRIGTGGAAIGSFQPLMEHPNRGKRSIGLALDKAEAREVLHRLVRTSDVFLVNFLPSARRKLHIDVDDVRAVNPEIIYVRGSAFGNHGPEREHGGYDSSAFWARAGSAYGVTPAGSPNVIGMPAGAYGDSMGGMTIAGGIAAALFARATTGETSEVDVSLLSVGAWAIALSANNAMLLGEAPPPPTPASSAMFNPVVGHYRTSDGRWINLTMLQPGRYWSELCRHLGREDLVTDERFATAEALMRPENTEAAAAILTDVFSKRTFSEWIAALEAMDAPWAPVQNPLEVANDPQLRANGYVRPVVDAEGNERELIANPVQFDNTPPDIRRGPQFAEHTDQILGELGYDEDRVLELKIAGAVT
jgi:crotonobetainyl-CoA:carnitine CoA-transferase CaiB-like acyl-CoA transferase